LFLRRFRAEGRDDQETHCRHWPAHRVETAVHALVIRITPAWGTPDPLVFACANRFALQRLCGISLKSESSLIGYHTRRLSDNGVVSKYMRAFDFAVFAQYGKLI
jgi:hypothetical protein